MNSTYLFQFCKCTTVLSRVILSSYFIYTQYVNICPKPNFPEAPQRLLGEAYLRQAEPNLWLGKLKLLEPRL